MYRQTGSNDEIENRKGKLSITFDTQGLQQRNKSSDAEIQDTSTSISILDSAQS